ncbi:MAG: signal peptidase II [Alphaproteobacteria bacterium]|nr:signal peptidase II [Alphaproteobacteria bacterium]MBO6627874.1 signal peptidase II [Alphaproteobacteria bacterium]MDF1625444.1 signal peptidase II [Parvibaculaceae bacterium]
MNAKSRSVKTILSDLVARTPLWGPMSVLGLVIALLAFLGDRLSKWWLMDVYGVADRGVIKLLPFLDIVMAWNKGISYGLFQAETGTGRAFLAGFAILVSGALYLWLARVNQRLLSVAIGLIIGGALGNIYDRLIFGAVADFFSPHAFGYYWYIFNVADVWISFGVILMMYDTFFGPDAKASRAGRGKV